MAPQTAAERFWTLDAMRGLAALVVVAWHAGAGRAVPGAYLSVDLFFSLSGFVLAHAYEARGIGFAPFMRARLIRLYPMYLAGLVVGVAVTLTAIEFDWRHWSILGFNLFMLPGPVAHTRAYFPFPFDGPAWSLFLELVINAVWIFLAPVLRPRVLYALLGLGAVMLTSSIISHGNVNIGSFGDYFLPIGFSRIFYSFFVGVAIYRFWRSGIWRPRAPALVILLLLSVLLLTKVAPLYRDIFAVLIGLPAIVFLGACAQPRPSLAPLFAALGAVSYGVYVLHAPIIQALRRMFYSAGKLRPWVPDFADGTATPFAIAALAIVFSVILTVLLSRYYDAPVRAWLTRITRRGAVAR